MSPSSLKIRLGLILAGTTSLALTFLLGWQFSQANAVRSPSEPQSDILSQFLLPPPPTIQPPPPETPTLKIPQFYQNQPVRGETLPKPKPSPPEPEPFTFSPQSPLPENTVNYPINPLNLQTHTPPKESLKPEPQTENSVNFNPNLSLTPFRAKIEPEKFTIAQTEPEINPNPEPNLSPTEPNQVQLELRDIIFLALENNRTIRNQYLERIVQQQDLAVAEGKFVPNLTPRIALDWRNIEQSGTTNTSSGAVLSAQLGMIIPTGGEVNLGWEGQRENRSGDGLSGRDNNIFRQNLELSFRQPLLRGGGIDLNQATIKIARINETTNLLDLKATLINQITNAILAYRRLLQAQERLIIEQNSLEIAQQQVENTQVLIDAGRQARVDIVPVQTRVANQEISVLNAENNLQQQRLALLEILDIDQDINIVAVEEVTSIESLSLDFETVQQLALENRPDYLKAQLDLERSNFELQIAENERRWNVDFNTNLRRDLAPDIIDDRTEVRAGIELRKTLGDRNIERDFQRSRVNVLQAENNLDEEFQQISLEVQNRIRDVNDNFRQVELAQRATQLAEEQFRNEEEKIRLGAGNTSIVDLVQFQERLGQARNNELNARIDYLNSITELNQAVGTTLETWNITLEQNINIESSRNNEQ